MKSRSRVTTVGIAAILLLMSAYIQFNYRKYAQYGTTSCQPIKYFEMFGENLNFIPSIGAKLTVEQLHELNISTESQARGHHDSNIRFVFFSNISQKFLINQAIGFSSLALENGYETNQIYILLGGNEASDVMKATIDILTSALGVNVIVYNKSEYFSIPNGHYAVVMGVTQNHRISFLSNSYTPCSLRRQFELY